MDREPPADKPPVRSRLEAEVQEILERVDRPPSTVVKFRTRTQQRRLIAMRRMKGALSGLHITSLRLLIACIVLAVVAVSVGDSSPFIARVLGYLSLGAFIAIFVIAFRRPKSESSKRWRGRDVDFGSSDRPDLLEWYRRRKPPKR